MGPELVSPDHTPIQPFRSLFKPSPSSRSPSCRGNPLPHHLDPPWAKGSPWADLPRQAPLEQALCHQTPHWSGSP